jgi:hypothetical protein
MQRRALSRTVAAGPPLLGAPLVPRLQWCPACTPPEVRTWPRPAAAGGTASLSRGAGNAGRERHARPRTGRLSPRGQSVAVTGVNCRPQAASRSCTACDAGRHSAEVTRLLYGKWSLSNRLN